MPPVKDRGAHQYYSPESIFHAPDSIENALIQVIIAFHAATGNGSDVAGAVVSKPVAKGILAILLQIRQDRCWPRRIAISSDILRRSISMFRSNH